MPKRKSDEFGDAEVRKETGCNRVQFIKQFVSASSI
jgi:hypothetical protein